jgi:hypothetical protein
MFYRKYFKYLNLMDEEERKKFLNYNSHRKKDGSLYRSRLEMKKRYNESFLPYPISAIFQLDYCYNIIKSHFKHCFFFSFPFTFLISYTFNSLVRTHGIKSKPFVYYVSLFILTYSSMIGILIIDSLITCDYCKPWSAVYYEKDRIDDYKNMLKSKIKKEQNDFDISKKITKDKGLRDNEL